MQFKIHTKHSSNVASKDIELNLFNTFLRFSNSTQTQNTLKYIHYLNFFMFDIMIKDLMEDLI